ncbi:hypothetical protein IC762_09150 [Bradyrhizobium genosp. L]|uniref:hypothetical protein n=1 Tax=Bradyrhizobium genosp. L TaxID=83637 RepID=UPI0018A31AEC|nr:hypothetical protein [Bradyrhizobium genosp. L]QPF86429.1 hypothetical protein IC762_09150 [Bradyrhizobium genosp. L]
MEREFAARQHCLCCGGVIDGLTDDGAIGLDTRFGLISDQCGFVCNDCTASLIQAALLRRRETVHRRWPTPGRRG